MASSSLNIATNSKYSIYDKSLGVVRPPFRRVRSIAYNGSYWLAGGSESIKVQTIQSYSQVENLRTQYENFKVLAETARLTKKLSDGVYAFDPTNTTANSLSQSNAQLYSYYSTLAESFKNQITAKELELQGTTKTSFTRRTPHTIAISYDGLSWTLLEDSPFNRNITVSSNYTSVGSISGCNSFAWNGSIWVAVGFDGGPNNTFLDSSAKSQIATSSDGITWTRQGGGGHALNLGGILYNFQGECRAVASGANIFVVVGNQFEIILPFNSSTNSRPLLRGCIATSSNGIDWVPVTNALTQGYCVAYNGALWVVGGTGGIVTSSNNGTSWNQRVTRTNDTYLCVAWNGNYWIACGQTHGSNGGFISKSDDGVTWETTDHDFIFNTIAWDGNFWNAGGDTSGIYKSKDGVEWIQKTTFDPQYPVSIYSIATKLVLPILGGTINSVTSLIAGYGAPMSVLRTYDNIKWVSQAIDGEGVNFLDRPQKEWNDVIWNGSKWVLVGEPYVNTFVTRTIATSENGIDWSFPATTSYSLRSVANNSDTVIAVGKDSKIMKTNLAATTWTEHTISLEDPLCVAWNGSYWLIGGTGGIIKSTDGTTWTPATVLPLTSVKKLAWNGYLWVAIGTGTNHTIALSINGIHWYIANPNTNPFTKCNSIAWNKEKWVAVGEGTNTIATSVDGFNWTGLGTTTFITSGTAIYWTGSKWIASGSGYYSMAESTNGTTWSIFETSIIKTNACADKNIELPYTGTLNNTVLSLINLVVTAITNSTNDSISFETLQAEIAASEQLAAEAAAEAAALRASTKATASGHRMKILYWKNRINAENQLYTHYKNVKTGVNIETLYPYEYSVSNGLNDALNIYATRMVEPYSEILDDENSQEVLNTNLQILSDYVTDIESNLVDYYSKTKFLISEMLTNITTYLTTTEFENKLSNYGFENETQKQEVLDFYNTNKDDFTSAVNSIKSTLTSAITSVSYTIDVSDYDYSSQVDPGIVLDLSQVSITTTDFINKGLTDTISRTLTVQSGGIGSRTINFEIGKILKTSAPNIYSLYSGVTVLDVNNPTDYTRLYSLNTVYNTYFPVKNKCDEYVEDAIDNAQKWDPSTLEQTIKDAFASYYTEFFYTLDETLYLPTNTNLVIPLKFFKLKYEFYASVAAYPTELGTISESLSDTIDTIDTAKTSALNYALNKKNTIIKPSLQTFLTDIGQSYNGTLQLDNYISEINANAFYSTSSLEVGKRLKVFTKIGSDLYPQLYQLIFDIKEADLEAEYDGATPPKNGWGTSTNGLSGADLGSPGQSGWEKFNNTYYTRQKLANYLAARTVNNAFITYEGMVESTQWKLFLSFTANYTYDKINEEKTALETVVSEITSNSSLTTGYIDSIVSTDLAAIDARYPIQGDAVIQSIKNSVTTKLPSNDDLTNYGDLKTSTSSTLQTYVNNINTLYSNLVNTANVDLTTKTKSEIAQIIVSVVNIKNSINAIQNSTNYNLVFDGIQLYKDRLAGATNYVSGVEDRVDRFVFLKNKYKTSLPFNLDEDISDGVGRPFIAGILPTNQLYWTQRTHPVVTYNNQKLHLTTALTALSTVDYPTYSNTAEYQVNEFVVYNSLIYQCVNVGTFDGDTSITVKGILPTNQIYWKQRTYPVVIYEGNNVEAGPSLASPLNYLAFSYYDSNWLYYPGDMVAYNGNIYECTNVTPAISLDATIQGVLPTNSNNWQTYTSQLVNYNIRPWSNSLLYERSSIVEYDGYIYKCEEVTTQFNLIPSENPVNWKVITSLEANIPEEYSPSKTYTINNIVSYRSFNTSLNKNQLLIYICYKTDTITPELYSYPTFSISDEKDEDDNYILQKETDGTYLSFGTPRYSPNLNSQDPFRVIGFARGLRRRVAMYVDMPYYRAFFATSSANNQMNTTYNLTNLIAKKTNTQTVHNAFVARINAAATKFDNNFDLMIDVYNNVYASLIEVLRVTLNQIIALRSRVNEIKSQYFYMPYVQKRVYDNPYSYLNPAVTAESGLKKFRDLGVGELDVITGDLEPGETNAELDYYNMQQPKIDDLEQEIYDKKLFAETIVGYDLLFQTMNSTKKIGSLIKCESTSFPGIYVPIADWNLDSYYDNPTLLTSPILWYVNEIIKESSRPPEYVTDTELATALTYETSNPIVLGLGRVAKGLVGLSAAAFQAAVPDPFMIFGLLNFVSGGAIPTPIQVSWPNFRDRAENRNAFKSQVNAIKNKFTIESEGRQLDGLNDTLIILGALLLLYSDMVEEVETIAKEVPKTFSYTAQVPNIPPPTYVPPKPTIVDIPNAKHVDFSREIISEINRIKTQIANIEQQKRILLGKKPLPPLPVDIPTVSNASVRANTANVPPKKWTVVNCNYNRNGVPIAAGSSTWQSKFPDKPTMEKAIDVRQALVDQQAVEVALAKKADIDAKYNAALQEWEEAKYKLEIEKANKITNLNNLNDSLSTAKLKEAYVNAKNQNAVLAAREEQLLKAIEEEKAAKLEYKKAVEAHRIAVEDAKVRVVDDLIEQAKLDIEAKRLNIQQTQIIFEGKTATVTSTAADFAEAIDDDVYLQDFIDDLIPPSVKAKYNAAIAKFTPVFRTFRRAEVFLRSRPAVRLAVKGANNPTLRKSMGAVGGLAVIAGVGLTAWQDGAFDE